MNLERYSPKNRVQLRRLARRNVAERHAALPPFPKGTYDIVYADPPWFYYGSQIKDAAAAKHYPLMTQEELEALPVRSIMSARSALFLWSTGPRLDFAVELIAKWGLRYRGVAYVWVKTNRRGEIIRGQGVPPTFTKPTTEFVLAATTMRTGRPFPLHDLAQGQVVLEPRAEHSRKPAAFRRLITELCGERPRIELFARERARGWDAWGPEERKFLSEQRPVMGDQDCDAGAAERGEEVDGVVADDAQPAKHRGGRTADVRVGLARARARRAPA
jgi:N6-adenosine-specific RNA methylase IME4